MEESRNVVEEVQAIEKTAKNLSVITVNPFAAGLDGVFAVRERNVVAHDQTGKQIPRSQHSCPAHSLDQSRCGAGSLAHR